MTMRRVLQMVGFMGMIGAVGWYFNGVMIGYGRGVSSPWLNALGLPAAVFLVALFLFVFSRNSGPSAAMRNAPIGIGTITATRRTGLALNDQPQMAISLRVQTADGHTFDSVAKRFVDYTELNSITPGTVLPVRYLPGNTKKVELDPGADLAAVQEVHHQIMVRAGISPRNALDIAARGVRTQGVVSAVRPTGEIVQGNSKMAITLLITRPDGTGFERTVEKVVPANLVGHVQVGRVITVHYLVSDESEIVFQLPANPGL